MSKKGNKSDQKNPESDYLLCKIQRSYARYVRTNFILGC